VLTLIAAALTGCYLFPSGNQPPPNNGPFATIYRFIGNAGGSMPGPVTIGPGGVVYGVAQAGGNCDTCGLVYSLTPPASGTTRWTFKVLHRFVQSSGGTAPVGRLALADNTLYGVTAAGGDAVCHCGVIYSLGTDGGNYRTLHVFTTAALGVQPLAGVLVDTDGTIYGTTSAGGADGGGVMFSLKRNTYAVLHNFIPFGPRPSGPQGELLFGQDGAIYGTQFGGGSFGNGEIFRFGKIGSAFDVIYNFGQTDPPGTPTDGARPDGALALGSDGTIYGTTTTGGTGLGTAWSIRKSGATWTYKQLRAFGGSDATVPHSGFVIGSDGTLYGTGSSGGTNGAGALFSLSRLGTSWRYRSLRSFTVGNPGGDTPSAPLAFDGSKIYGTTASGGTSGCSGAGCGTVFTDQP
jgi:uncharacterized repeat protein (TIGR03803 family)